MSNPIADFMRQEVALNEQAIQLRLRPRVCTQQEMEMFFLKAADEIDALQSSLKEMLAAYWQDGDGKEPPEFIQRAIQLSK